MITAKQIDTLLPQTQCGLCGYASCMPYAEALANQTAEINLCPPGGVKGLIALADLLKKDATPFIAEMEQKAKPYRVAVIREAECIGCTKCIQACPVDAILGMAKQMHSVIASECTGCELCIAPCPVDCIDLLDTTAQPRPDYWRERYTARTQRLQQEKNQPMQTVVVPAVEKQSYVQAALMRVKTRKKR